jgi:hypothetical protein
MSSERVDDPATGPLTQAHVDAAVRAFDRISEACSVARVMSPEVQIILRGDCEEAFRRADGFSATPFEEQIAALYWILPHWSQRYAYALLTAVRAPENLRAPLRDSLRGPGDDPWAHAARVDALCALDEIDEAERKRLYADPMAARQAAAAFLSRSSGS